MWYPSDSCPGRLRFVQPDRVRSYMQGFDHPPRCPRSLLRQLSLCREKKLSVHFRSPSEEIVATQGQWHGNLRYRGCHCNHSFRCRARSAWYAKRRHYTIVPGTHHILRMGILGSTGDSSRQARGISESLHDLCRTAGSGIVDLLSRLLRGYDGKFDFGSVAMATCIT